MNTSEQQTLGFEPPVSELQKVFESNSAVLSAYIFGSAAMGLLRKNSDIDIAVRLKEDLPPQETNDLRLKLHDILEHVFQRKVDVVVMNGASLKMIHQVYKNGLLVYAVDLSNELEFRIQKQKEYFDFQYYLEKERHDLRSFYDC